MMRGLALNTVARSVVILFQLINVKLYTHYLDASQLGIYFFLLSFSYSANALLFVPVDYYQQANLARVRQETGGLRPLLAFNGRLGGIYAAFSLLTIVVCTVAWPDHVLEALLMASLAYAMYLMQSLRNTLNNLEHRNCVSISFIQEAVLKVALFSLLVQIFQADSALLLISLLLALMLTTAYLAWKAHGYDLFAGDAGSLKVHAEEVFHFSYPFSIGAICNLLQLQGYRLILVPCGYAEAVGIFATLSSLGTAAVNAVSLIYSQQFTPMLYKSVGRYTARYMQGALIVIFSVAVVALVSGEIVARMLTSPGFAEYWKLMMFGVFTDGANMLIGALAIHITLTGDTKRIVPSAFIGLFSMIACFVLLYWTIGISAATIGIPLLISQWLVTFHMFSICRDGSSGFCKAVDK